MNKNLLPSKKGFLKSRLLPITLLVLGFCAHQAHAQVTINSVTPSACSGTDNTYSAEVNYTLGTSGLTTGELVVTVENGKTNVIINTQAPGTYSTTLTGLNADGASHNVTATFTQVNPPASASATFTAPSRCVTFTCASNTATSQTYSNSLPLQHTDLDNASIPIPKFNTAGGTRVLQKVLVSARYTGVSNVLFEYQAETASTVTKALWTIYGSIGIGSAASAPSVQVTTAWNMREVAGLNKRLVPAAGSWPGDVLVNGVPSTLQAMENNYANMISTSLANLTNPNTLPGWVTTVTGNPADDDDFLYVGPYPVANTTNLVLTSGFSDYIGTGNIDFKASSLSGIAFVGSGGNLTFMQGSRVAVAIDVTYFYCDTALPVDLTYFTADKLEEKINLSWTTAQEKKFDRFELQKSNNAKSFETIASIKGTNSEAHNYSGSYNYRDAEPWEGNNYYRLKMVDLDGSYKYSKIINFNFIKGDTYVAVENPASNGAFTVMTNLVNPVFALVNTNGQRMNLSMSKTSNSTYIIKAGPVSQGLYILKITSNGRDITKKILMP